MRRGLERYSAGPSKAEIQKQEGLDELVSLHWNEDLFGPPEWVFEAAARRYPGDPRMLLHLAVAQAANGEKARGLETLETAIRLAKTRNGLKDSLNKEVIEAAEAARTRLRG